MATALGASASVTCIPDALSPFGERIGIDRLAGPQTRRFLNAVRNVAETAGLDLIRLDRTTGAVLVVSRDASDRAPPSLPLRDALAGSGSFMFAGERQRWIEGWPDKSHATLVAPIAELESHDYFLAVRVTDTVEARIRTLELMPDLLSLVGLHCEAEAQRHRLLEDRDAAAQALDHGECGIVAIRSDHSIILANAAAHAMLASKSGLRIHRGTLQPTSYVDAVRLRQAIDQVTGSADQAHCPPQAIVMLLSDKVDAYRPMLVIAPGQKQPDASGGAASIIYLFQPSDGEPRGLEALCKVHGLSKVESRLTIHLTNGLAMAEAACAMRIKVETARSYLKQIFGKVGVHRQADLIRLMSRYQRAIRGDFDFQVA